MMANKPRIVVLIALLLMTGGAADVLAHGRPGFQVPTFPRATQRGHIRIRNGVFGSTYRERWGNGLTPYGAAVITGVVSNAAMVANNYLTVASGQAPPATSQPQADPGGSSSTTVGNSGAENAAEPEAAREAREAREAKDEIRTQALNDAIDKSKKAFELLGLEWKESELTTSTSSSSGEKPSVVKSHTGDGGQTPGTRGTEEKVERSPTKKE